MKRISIRKALFALFKSFSNYRLSLFDVVPYEHLSQQRLYDFRKRKLLIANIFLQAFRRVIKKCGHKIKNVEKINCNFLIYSQIVQITSL